MEGESIYRDYAAMCPEFREGIAHLADNNHEAALHDFARADINASRDDVYKHKYQSFHGLMLVYAGQSRGIDLCRMAGAQECFDGDVFYNLARAELELGNRRQAIAALRRGLDFDNTHPDLGRLRQRLGVRRKLAIPFLGRDNPLNKLIGKLTYRRALYI